jgi:hypothetical protein
MVVHTISVCIGVGRPQLTRPSDRLSFQWVTTEDFLKIFVIEFLDCRQWQGGGWRNGRIGGSSDTFGIGRRAAGRM